MKGSIKVIQSALVLASTVGAFQMPAYHSSSKITGMKHVNRPVILKDKNIHNNNVLVNSLLSSTETSYQKKKDFQLSAVPELVAESGIILSSAGVSIVSNPLGSLIWFLLPTIYALGYNSTKICNEDLNKIKNDQPGYKPVFEGWAHLKEINAVDAILDHVKFGSPSILMYIAASFFAFPLIGLGGIVLTIGSLFTIVASALFFVCMACMTPALLNMIKEGFTPKYTAGALVLFVTTLPCLQLATWQIEYALRFLTSNPTDMVLPDLWLNLMHITNTLRPLINPMNSLYDNTIFPEDFNTAGHAIVSALDNADKYANPSDIPLTPLTMNDLTVLNQGLMVAVVYGLVAPFPTLAAITNFGFEEVKMSKCPFSQNIMKILKQDNFADLNAYDFGLYGVITIVWTMLGNELLASYTS
jgi:hypothetical protein